MHTVKSKEAAERHSDGASRLSVAPMMAWTDRHCRRFHRAMSRNVLLYTEMVTSAALVRGDAAHLLQYSEAEHPIALQLGGADPKELAAAARMAEAEGYDEINLNVGCPSDRVQNGSFGAVLMKSPDLVAECVMQMQSQVSVPVTVKCRIGVDDQDPLVVLPDFLSKMAQAGVRHITVHARKAWLQGLSPKENRDIPPLDYELVQDMLSRFPNLRISLNGGITSLDMAEEILGRGFHGVMIGRSAYHQPADILLDADRRIWGAAQAPTRVDVLAEMEPYIADHLQAGGSLHQITRHMLGLFAGRPGARAWRRILSEGATRTGAGLDLLHQAAAAVPEMGKGSLVDAAE